MAPRHRAEHHQQARREEHPVQALDAGHQRLRVALGEPAILNGDARLLRKILEQLLSTPTPRTGQVSLKKRRCVTR